MTTIRSVGSAVCLAWIRLARSSAWAWRLARMRAPVVGQPLLPAV
jgi:hypothetical protein